MRDILPDLIRWTNEGKTVALATVIQTWGSSPRQAGSKLGLTADGKIAGSVSGGCVENAVIEAGLETLKTKRPQLLHFGVADEAAWDVGLACGGSIDVFVKPLDKNIFDALKTILLNNGQATLATVIRGRDESLGDETLIHEDGTVMGLAGNEWEEKGFYLVREIPVKEKPHRIMLNETTEIFVETILPPLTLVMVGGAHISMALSSLAKTLGYRSVVIDPRSAWGNEERFPHVDQLVQAWPPEAFEQVRVTRSTAIATLTHDPKLDDPALKFALSSSAFYVGALGSNSTNEKRRKRLLNDGVSETQLSRLHAPIGLNIGAQSPEEIALAIMAEVVDAHRRQKQASVEDEAKPVSSL